MFFARKISILVAICSTLLAACGSGIATSTPMDDDAVSTSLVATLVAGVFEAQTASAPIKTPSKTVAPATASPRATLTALSASPTFYYFTPTLGTPTMTFTPSVTGTIFTSTVDPNTLAYGCNNLAFVRDVTVPAGTVLKPGEDFGKTWKVANIGTCDWLYQYQIVLLSGDAMQGKTTKLNRVVTAGHWGELTVQMGAPKAPGTYTAYWRLADADAHMFGSSLAVSIVVDEDPPTETEPADTPTNTAEATATPTP
jgi:hypothetical protein